MNQPAHIANFTADNPGMMTLQGTNQYIVGKDSAVVIDVALSSDGNMDGIIEQADREYVVQPRDTVDRVLVPIGILRSDQHRGPR